MASNTSFPTTGTRTALSTEIQTYYHLRGEENVHAEQKQHHSVSQGKRHPVSEVKFTTILGPHGKVLVRIFYLKGHRSLARAMQRQSSSTVAGTRSALSTSSRTVFDF
ncbi:hypothetical protein LTS10_010766 [Elasticomyces elasticus]|nr:hypothetical protein LTS10_010766 [Elasticomyces elasticus]